MCTNHNDSSANTLQHTATHCNNWTNSNASCATHCNTMTNRATLSHTATQWHMVQLQHNATWCNSLRCLTQCHIVQLQPIFRNTLHNCLSQTTLVQHTATHCNTCTNSNDSSQCAIRSGEKNMRISYAIALSNVVNSFSLTHSYVCVYVCVYVSWLIQTGLMHTTHPHLIRHCLRIHIKTWLIHIKTWLMPIRHTRLIRHCPSYTPCQISRVRAAWRVGTWRYSFVCNVTLHICMRYDAFIWDMTHSDETCTSPCDGYGKYATHCNSLQHTTAHPNTLQHTATRCNTPQHTAKNCKRPSSHMQWKRQVCNSLQLTATHCKTLQHTATRCNRPSSSDGTGKEIPYVLYSACLSTWRASHPKSCLSTWRASHPKSLTSCRRFGGKQTLVHDSVCLSIISYVYRSFLSYIIPYVYRHCNTLQHTATHCNTLQHTATHYIIPYVYRLGAWLTKP